MFNFRNLLGDNIMIDVYEKADKVGGRMAVTNVNGHMIECGGAIVHEQHKLMCSLIDYCGECTI